MDRTLNRKEVATIYIIHYARESQLELIPAESIIPVIVDTVNFWLSTIAPVDCFQVMLPSQSDWVQVPITHENTLPHHVFDHVQTLEPGQVLRYRPESEGYAHCISMDQLGHYVLTHHRVVGHKSFVHEDPDDNYVHPLTIAWLDETDHPYHFHHYRHSLDHTSITTGTVPDFLDYCLKTIETLSGTPYKVLANVWHYRPTINMAGEVWLAQPFQDYVRLSYEKLQAGQAVIFFLCDEVDNHHIARIDMGRSDTGYYYAVFDHIESLERITVGPIPT